MKIARNITALTIATVIAFTAGVSIQGANGRTGAPAPTTTATTVPGPDLGKLKPPATTVPKPLGRVGSTLPDSGGDVPGVDRDGLRGCK